MDKLTFYFDRTFGIRLPRALASLKPPMDVRWHQLERFPQAMPDDEWLPIVGAKNWVVLTQDRKFHVRSNEAEAIRQHGVRCFYLPGASEDRWVLLCHFIRRHEKIQAIARAENAPFIFELKASGHFRPVLRS